MSYQTWRLDNKNQTLIFSSESNQIPECIYWGEKLYHDFDLELLPVYQKRSRGVSSFDSYVPLSLIPESTKGWLGQVGLISDSIKYPFVIQNTNDNKNEIHWILISEESELNLNIKIKCLDYTVELKSYILDKNQKEYKIQYLSTPVLPVSEYSSVIKDFSGKWCGEFQEQLTNWNFGIRMRQSLEGRTSHSNFPGVIVPEFNATNCKGNVYGWSFAWSGSHKMIAEEAMDGRRQIQFSKIDASSRSESLYTSYSSEGFNGLMNNFHELVRNHITRPIANLPVIYNCWEAVYFDHNIDNLKKLAKKSNDLGAELFVLDDGWFKDRNDDTSSLGDWEVDKKKFPDGLKPFIDYLKNLNMIFGIWLEPEMINEKSDLFKKHPDWVLGVTLKKQLKARNQYVLNLSKKAVYDYIFNCIDNLMSEYDISYIKWDHNRPLIGVNSKQTEQLYKLLQQVKQKYPKLHIESCASGGGRIDYGILKYTNRVWLSDSNDAYQRAKIQYESVLFLPPEITGSHVGSSKCHNSGRTFSMSFRAWIAAQRYLGFEFDLNKLTQEEYNILKYVTNWWKKNRSWRFSGKTHRLEQNDKNVLSEINISKQQDRFILFSTQLDTSEHNSKRPLKLTGLIESAKYELKLLTTENFQTCINHNDYSFPLLEKKIILTGEILMKQGIYLPVSFPNSVWVIEGKAINLNYKATK